MLMTALWLFWILGIQTGVLNRVSSTVTPEKNEIAWETYSESRLQEVRARGEAVFIDFTAAWCLTCQWNKKTALQRAATVKIFKEKKIHAFQADWTSHDPAVTRALQSYGRKSIPFYVFYAAGAEEPVFLPELLTPEILRRYLD